MEGEVYVVEIKSRPPDSRRISHSHIQNIQRKFQLSTAPCSFDSGKSLMLNSCLLT